jgi:hypothetical protein
MSSWSRHDHSDQVEDNSAVVRDHSVRWHMEQRKVRGSAHNMNLDGKGSTSAVVVHARCSSRGDLRRVRVAHARRRIRRIHRRNEAASLQISRVIMFTKRNLHLPLLSRDTKRENEPCQLRWDLGRSSQVAPQPANDHLMTLHEVQSIHPGDIAASFTHHAR